MTTEVVAYRPSPKLSPAFVAARLRPGWKDLLWAARNQWLDTNAVAEFASQIPVHDDVRAEVAAAAMEPDGGGLRGVLEREAARDPTPDDVIRDHWMRIAVAWLYEHRDEFPDPWAEIEEIWEAFDHAEALSGLIRWMPLPEGAETGEAAMLERWRAMAME